MLIKGSEIRKLIREELTRAMMREGDPPVDVGAAVGATADNAEDNAGQIVTSKQDFVSKGDIPYTTMNQEEAVKEIQKTIGDSQTGKWVKGDTDINLFAWIKQKLAAAAPPAHARAGSTGQQQAFDKLFSNPKGWKWASTAPQITKMNGKPVTYTPDAVGLLRFLKDLESVKIPPMSTDTDFNYGSELPRQSTGVKPATDSYAVPKKNFPSSAETVKERFLRRKG